MRNRGEAEMVSRRVLLRRAATVGGAIVCALALVISRKLSNAHSRFFIKLDTINR